MTRRQTPSTSRPGVQVRRRRVPRPLEVVPSPHADQEQDEAAGLVADLLALVDAGLLEVRAQDGELRYWPRDPGDAAA